MIEFNEFVVDEYYQPKETKMKSILKFLDGKKVIVAGVITTTAAFMAVKGVVDADTVAYISTLCTFIFGTASVVTTSLQKSGDL